MRKNGKTFVNTKKSLTLGRVASKLAKFTQNFLDKLDPAERKKRLDAFKAVVSDAPSSDERDLGGTQSMSGKTRRTPQSRVVARARG